MAVPEETRHRLSEWCAARIPEPEREQHRIGYTIQGAEVTITDRQAPAFPELGAEWTSTPLARLHLGAGGEWSLHRPGARGGWERAEVGDDPIALLDRVTAGQAPA